MRSDGEVRAFRGAARTLLAVTILCSAVSPGTAQSFSYRDINPSQSSLDATDADGASGGRVNGLGRAPNGTTFFAASEWGGLYRSTDSGVNWAHLPGHLPMVTWDVEVDPSNGNRVYATSHYDGRVNSLSGINVSTDGGNTWTHPATATPPANFCESEARRDNPAAFGIAIDSVNNAHVFVGTNCGLAVSTDSGLTWSFIDPTPADGADDVWDVVVQDSLIDLCGDDGHRRSVDRGVTWTTATANALPGGRCSIVRSPDERNVLYAVVGTAISESVDGGNSWPNPITNPNPQGRIPFVAINQRTGAGFDLWFGDTQLHRASCTTPGGGGNAARCPQNTWVGPFTRAAGAHDDAGDVVFASAANDGCPVLFSSDGGVYRNTTAASPGCQSPTWEQPTVSPHALWLYSMAGADQATTANEDLYMGAQDNGSFGTTNAPAAAPTWTNSNCCDAHNFTATATRALFTICCFNTAPPANRLFLRNSGLAGGGQFANPPAGNLRSFREQDGIAHFTANGVVAITSTGVFMTSNITAAPPVWRQLGAASQPANAQDIYVADSSGTPVFFALAGDGNGVTEDRLFRFKDTIPGGNWTEILPPSDTGGFGIVAVERRNPQRLYASHLVAGTDPQMIRSNDGGLTWVGIPLLDNLMTAGGTFRYVNERGSVVRGATGAGSRFEGYPQPTLLAIDPVNPNTVVAGGADSGIFLSLDAGTSWSRITDPLTPATSGIPHLPRPHFAYFDRETNSIWNDELNIYVGTQGRGAWRITRTTSRFIAICGVDFRRCFHPKLDPHLINIDCIRLTLDECKFIDPIPKNCEVKYDCPGCGPNMLCPPFYHFVLDGLDPAVWDLAVFTGRGDPVDYQLARTRTGTVVSFRPDKKLFKPGRVGDYVLAFALRPGAKPDRYQFRASLQLGNDFYGRKIGEVATIVRAGSDRSGAPLR